ncbi:MAG: hypothetical protein U5J96_15320 [Ignavibacteriaceae bacterium]|nr:hypothetical protein [Ignavibacteriaceae bacterium]
MENNNLVEKLSLQAESFQEGFEILCKSFSFDEMVKNFLHLMRGNFIISEIIAYHKKQFDSDWKVIASKEKSVNQLIYLFLKNQGVSLFNISKKINMMFLFFFLWQINLIWEFYWSLKLDQGGIN